MSKIKLKDNIFDYFNWLNNKEKTEDFRKFDNI